MRSVIDAYSRPRPGTDDAVLSQSINKLDATLQAHQAATRRPKPWRPRCEINRRRWVQADPEPEDEWEIVSKASIPKKDNAAPAKGKVTIVFSEDREDKRRPWKEEVESDPFSDRAAVSSASSSPDPSSSAASSSSFKSTYSNKENKGPASAHSASIGRVLESPANSDPFADTNEQALSSYDSGSSSISELSLPSDWTDHEEHMRLVGAGRGGLQTRRDSREVTRSRMAERAARLREAA